MSIDPLKFPALPPFANGMQAGSAGAKQVEKNFAQQLDAAKLPTKPPQKIVAEAQALLKLAQLHLMQGLFDSEEELGDDIFTRFNNIENLPRPVAARNQNAEALYQRLQPSVTALAPTGRGEIEKMIDQVAEKVSLAPELIRSVVAAESNFKPDAISQAGAQGLMQLMPATAQDLGVKDSFDPEQNLLGGGRYLKQMLDKYDGDLDKALAAYNWGPGNVDRKGLEQMPQETRSYLAKVKSRLAEQV